jgi:hypothetical protein
VTMPTGPRLLFVDRRHGVGAARSITLARTSPTGANTHASGTSILRRVNLIPVHTTIRPHFHRSSITDYSFAGATTMQRPATSWSSNQHDDEPCELDLDRVMTLVRNGDDVHSAATAAARHEAPVQAAAPPRAGSAGWAVFNQWISRETNTRASAVTPSHHRPGTASGNNTFTSDTPGIVDNVVADAPMRQRATPVQSLSMARGGATTPPHNDADGGVWATPYGCMATPPRPSTHKSLTEFASDAIAAPYPVPAFTSPSSSTRPYSRVDGSVHAAALNSAASRTSTFNANATEFSSVRRERDSSVPMHQPLLFHGLESPGQQAGSPPAGYAMPMNQFDRLPAAAVRDDAATDFPSPNTAARAVLAAQHHVSYHPVSDGLNTTAAPFTPKRIPSAASLATTYTDTPLRNLDVTPSHLTPPHPAAFANPALLGSPGMHAANSATMDQLKANAATAAKDQMGCRLLQRVLDMPWLSQDVQDVFQRLYPALPDLMADAYGNFLVQKLLDVAPDDVRLDMTRLVAPHLAHVATTPHGTFAAQKLVDSLRSAEERAAVCHGLAHSVVLLCTDHNGAHVVQKVVAAVGPTDRAVLFEGIAENIVAISNNRYGTCIVQRCLERSFSCPPQYDMLASAIVAKCTSLVQDPYGNYVVQRLLEQCGTHSQAVDNIVAAITSATVFSSDSFGASISSTSHNSDEVSAAASAELMRAVVTSQYSSKAVEKALQKASHVVAARFAAAMARRAPVLPSAIKDQFGNYIVQTAIALATAALHAAASAEVGPTSRPGWSARSATSAAPADPDALVVEASDTVPDGYGSYLSLAQSPDSLDLPSHDVAETVMLYAEFLSKAEEHIALVRGLGFQKKMEHKLDQALRALRSFRARPMRGVNPTCHHAGGGSLHQQQQQPQQQQQQPQQQSSHQAPADGRSSRGAQARQSNGRNSNNATPQAPRPTARPGSAPFSVTAHFASNAPQDATTPGTVSAADNATPLRGRRSSGGVGPSSGRGTPQHQAGVEPSQRRRPPHLPAAHA